MNRTEPHRIILYTKSNGQHRSNKAIFNSRTEPHSRNSCLPKRHSTVTKVGHTAAAPNRTVGPNISSKNRTEPNRVTSAFLRTALTGRTVSLLKIIHRASTNNHKGRSKLVVSRCHGPQPWVELENIFPAVQSQGFLIAKMKEVIFRCSNKLLVPVCTSFCLLAFSLGC